MTFESPGGVASAGRECRQSQRTFAQPKASHCPKEKELDHMPHYRLLILI
jgi:hypothetical protein